MRVSAHALCDWGIWTGRVPLDARADFLARFGADPVATVGELFTTAPTRYADRPCPLFTTDAIRSAGARSAYSTRTRRAEQTAEQTAVILDAVIDNLGHDLDDQQTRAAVADAVRSVQAADRAGRRQARKTAELEARGRARLDPADRAFAQLADKWAEPVPDGPSDEQLRQEFVDSLRGQLSQAAQARRARAVAKAAERAAHQAERDQRKAELARLEAAADASSEAVRTGATSAGAR